jgi:heavy metal sensor kinase
MFRVFKTIRGKLTLYFTIIFGLTLIIFSAVLYSIFAGNIRNDFDLVMTAFAVSISETIKEGGVTPDILTEIRDLNNPGLSPYNGFVMVYNSSGMLVIKSRQLEPVDIQFNRDLINRSLNGMKEYSTEFKQPVNNLWDENGIRLLYYPATHRGHRYALVLISPLSGQAQTLNSLKLVLFSAVPVTLLLSALIGWFFSKKAYEPVSRLVEKTKSITAEKLHERLAVDDVDDEISRLSVTLNKMIERLESSFKTLKQFTSDASHELKTPLTIMKGEIEVAMKKSRTAGEYKQILLNSLEEVNHLQQIVESLITLSQYENKKIALNIEIIDLNDLVIDAVTKSRLIASRKSIKLILHLNEDDHADFTVKGDRKKIMNVFLNLIDNATKYSAPNSEVNIFTLFDSSFKNAVVKIEDNGIGISEENLVNIFDRFYRADVSRTRGDDYSLGLGLSLVKAAIEAHGGVVSVSSKLGKGSVFTVSLPLVRK